MDVIVTLVLLVAGYALASLGVWLLSKRLEGSHKDWVESNRRLAAELARRHAETILRDPRPYRWYHPHR